MLAVVAGCASSVFAQQDGDFFFSFSGTGDTPDNPSAEFAEGDSGSLFLYYSGTSDIDTGFGFDLLSDSAGVINFTGSEIFSNPAGYAWRPRWATVASGNADGDSVTGVVTVNLTSVLKVGIDVDNPKDDADYFADTDSFLLGRFDFDVAGSVGDTTEISFVDGEFPITVVNGGALLDIAFGSATINVAGSAIPEPATTGLLAISLACLVTCRRR